MQYMRTGLLVSVLTLVLATSIFFAVPAAGAQAQKAGQKITWIFATNPGPAANTWSFYPYPRFQKLLVNGLREGLLHRLAAVDDGYDGVVR
jgi:hypothetical protein